MENKMFCFQCQETLSNKGCTLQGVCGKKASTANLQDLLIKVSKELAFYLQNSDITDKSDYYNQIDYNLFVTITNANFDDLMIQDIINKTVDLIKKLDSNYQFDLTSSLKIASILEESDEDIRSLKELITYGLKGMAAYHHHATHLGFSDNDIHEFMIKTLVKLNQKLDVQTLIDLTLETGNYGVKVMALLDKANTSCYGHPAISKVNIGVGNKPGILVTGHDLKDLEQLLEQSKNSGIDIYTHGEMLPAHYYPFFKKYNHFFGNYGNAWWRQKEEFSSFNGPILFTTNCLVPPKESYKDRVYTTGAVGFSGLKRINEKDGQKDFSAIIKHAKQTLPPIEIEQGQIIGGFAHNQVLRLADKVVDCVKTGKIKKFVVMAGCDGRMKDRKYYTDFANSLPKDTIILTAGCAKYRYNKLNLGDIDGIPRVLDAGQCNDSYSLALIALKLKEVFNLADINELPIVYNIAWYEQKAVIVLLALLALGVKNIHLGPTLPAFLSPNVAKFLVENFNIQGIQTVGDDIKLFFPNEEKLPRFHKDMIVAEIINTNEKAANVLVNAGMGCLGCPASQSETLADACLVHGLDLNTILNALNEVE